MADTYVVLRVGMQQLLIAEPRAFPPAPAGSSRATRVRSLLTRALHDRNELEKLRQFLHQHPGSQSATPHDPHAPESSLVAALDNALARGQLIALLMDHVPAVVVSRSIKLSNTPSSQPLGTLGDRFKTVIERAIELAPGVIGDDLKELCSTKSLLSLVEFAGLMIALHAAGVGVEADAVALGIAYALGGYKAVKGLFLFGKFVMMVCAPSTQVNPDPAARVLIEALEDIGVAVITAVLMRRVNPSAGGEAAEGEAQVNAYNTPVEREALNSPAPPSLSAQAKPKIGVVGQTASAAETTVPRGFSNIEEFSQFGSKLHRGLADAGYTDAQGILQGSAVTGKSFRPPYQVFDVGRVSDFDIALSGDSLFQAAQDAGIGLRSAGTRTGPLNERALQKLGLFDLSTELSAQAGRPVNFMIYQSTETAVNRAPSILFQK